MSAMSIEVVPLLVYALAFIRVVYLVTTDAITEDARHAVIAWLDDRPATLGAFIAKAIQCPWCFSVWLAMPAAPIIWFWGSSPWLLVPALGLALSQLAGMLSDLGR